MAFLFGRDVGRDALRGGRREREEEFEKVEMVEGEGRLKRKKKKKKNAWWWCGGAFVWCGFGRGDPTDKKDGWRAAEAAMGRWEGLDGPLEGGCDEAEDRQRPQARRPGGGWAVQGIYDWRRPSVSATCTSAG
jgi:hypothetical protein